MRMLLVFGCHNYYYMGRSSATQTPLSNPPPHAGAPGEERTDPLHFHAMMFFCAVEVAT